MSLQRLAIPAGIALIAVIAAIVISTSSSSGNDPEQPTGPTVDTSAAALVEGIPEKAGVLGDPDAPLTLTEFVDLQCPVCAEAARSTLPTIVADYVKPGKVKLDVRVLQFLGPDSVTAATFAAGVREQGRLWPFLETFFASQGEENSGYVTDGFLDDVAAAAGVDAAAARSVVNPEARLNEANDQAQALGINATPSWVLTDAKGSRRVVGSGLMSPAALAAELDR